MRHLLPLVAGAAGAGAALLTLLARGPVPMRLPAAPPARRGPPVLPRVTGRGVLAAGVALVLALVLGPLGTAVAGVTGVVSWRRIRARRAAGRDRATARVLTEAIGLLLVLLEAGSTVRSALADLVDLVPPDPCVTPALRRSVHLLERGSTVGEALEELGAVGPRAAPLVRTLIAATADGTPLGPELDRLAVALQADLRRAAEAEARALPVRLSLPLVICVLPGFLLMTLGPTLVGAVGALRPLLGS